ncbi:MAG: RNA polymerase sigma factor [Planctomycetes bacterium]|nr:RNA polymerase sigma factor [Planctomycetota bacterium]
MANLIDKLAVPTSWVGVHLGVERPGDGGVQPAVPFAGPPTVPLGEGDELALRAALGDADAFEALVRDHYRAVFKTSYAMTRNLEDAHDLTQECFTRAWERRAEYRADAPYRAWLASIVRNRLRDELRARHRRGTAQQLGDELLLDERTLDVGLLDEELELGLQRELARLPESERRALVLRVVDEREYDDVAATLGVRPATARTLVMKARRSLLARLWNVLGGGRP